MLLALRREMDASTIMNLLALAFSLVAIISSDTIAVLFRDFGAESLNSPWATLRVSFGRASSR
jgi:hypothetical protein